MLPEPGGVVTLGELLRHTTSTTLVAERALILARFPCGIRHETAATVALQERRWTAHVEHELHRKRGEELAVANALA